MKHTAPPPLRRILGWCGFLLLVLLPSLSNAQALGGRITVGWGRQFTYLNDAIARLNQYGDSSAVTLVLDSGWHNLERNLERTLQYPLTFVSNDRDSSSTFIYGYGSRQYPYREIFSGSNSYIFKHLTFTQPWGPPTDEYQGLYFMGSKGLQIDSCAVNNFYYTGSGSVAFQGTTFHSAISVGPDTSHSQLETIRIQQCAYRYSSVDENLANNSNRFWMYFSKAHHVSIDDFKVSIPRVNLAPYGTVFNIAQMDSVQISRMYAASCYLLINLSYIKSLYLHDNAFHTSYEDSSYGGAYGTGAWDDIWNTVYFGDLQLHGIKNGRIENNILTHQGASNLWAITHSLVYRQSSGTSIAGDENLRIANNTISGYYFGINHLAFTQDPRSPQSNTTTIEHNTIHVKRVAIHIPSTGLYADSFAYNPYPQYPTKFRILRNTITSKRYGLHIQGTLGLIACNYIEADTGLFYGDARLSIFGNTIGSNRSALHMYGFIGNSSLRQNILYSKNQLVYAYLYPEGDNLYTLPGGENMYHSPILTPFYYAGRYINKQEYDFDRIQWVNPADRRSLWGDPGFVLPGSPAVTNARLAPAPSDTLAYNIDIDSLPRLPINFYGCKKPAFCTQNLALLEILPTDQGSSHQYRAVVRNMGSSAMSGTRLYGQLNENPPVPMAVPSLAPGQSDTIQFPAWAADSAQVLRFRAYLSGPTQFQDCSAADDTLRHVRYPARYCGSYTVGGVQASFPSLYVALYRLNVAGLRCPVELRLRPGIYPTTIGFDTCPGLSDTNSLTIRADQEDSSTVHIAPGPWPLRYPNQRYYYDYNFIASPRSFGSIAFDKISFEDLNLASHLQSGSFSHCAFSGITKARYLGEVRFDRCQFQKRLIVDDPGYGYRSQYTPKPSALQFSKSSFLGGVSFLPVLGAISKTTALFEDCYLTNQDSSQVIGAYWATRWSSGWYHYTPPRNYQLKNCRLESLGLLGPFGALRAFDTLLIESSTLLFQGSTNYSSASALSCGVLEVPDGYKLYRGFCRIRNSQIKSLDTSAQAIASLSRLQLESNYFTGFKSVATCRNFDSAYCLIAKANTIRTTENCLTLYGRATVYDNYIKQGKGIVFYPYTYSYLNRPNPSQFFNNIISSKNVVLDGCFADIYNNTLISASGPVIRARYYFDSQNLTLRNNIIYTYHSDTLLTIQYPRGSTSSHNILHTSGPILARIGDTVYNSLDSIQARGYELGSLAVDPYLSSDSIPVPLNPAVANIGTYIPGLRTDYFGHPRDTLHPDPGAVEMGPPPRLVRLLAPYHTCYLTAAERVQVQLTGAYPGMILAYRLDTNTIRRDTLPGNLYRYTFLQPIDLSAGSHRLQIWIQGSPDTLASIFSSQSIPIPRLSASAACLSDTVPFQVDAASGSFPGPVWLYFGDGDSVQSSTAHHLYTKAGTYKAVARAYSADSTCFTTDSVLVRPFPLPDATFTLRSACKDRPLDILTQPLDSSRGPYHHLWQWGDGRQDTAAHPTSIYTQAGSYLIRLHITTAHGCQDTASVWVDIQPAPQVSLFPAGTITLRPGIPVALRAPHTGGSLRWSTGSTDSVLNVTLPGTYSATVRAPGGCIAQSDTVRVRQLEPLTVSIGPNRFGCAGDSFLLAGPPGMAYYRWSTGDTNSTLSVAQSGTYTLTVSDSLGRRATAQVWVRIKPRQTVSYQIPAGPHCRADSPFRVRSSISLFRFEGNGVTTAGVVDPTQADSVIDFRLIPTDTSVCSDTVSGRIYIHSNPPAPSFANYFYTLCIGDTIWVHAEPPSMHLRWTDGTGFPTPRPLYRPGRYTAWAISDSGCPSPQAWPLLIDSVGTLPTPGILRSGDTLRAVDNAPQVDHYWERYLFGYNLPDPNFNGFGNPSFVLADQPGTYVLYSTSPPLCRRIDSLIVPAVVAIHHRETGLSLFPSPVDEVLTLHASPGTSIVSLSDPLGRTLPAVTQEPHRISVKHLSSGTYILHVREPDGTLHHLTFLKR